MRLVLYAAAGGAIGTVARHLANVGFGRWLGAGFPWSTLFVNVVGGFLMGALIEALALRFDGSLELRTFIATGIVLSTFGFLNLCVLAPTRVYYAMATDRAFFPQVARLHPRYQTPSLAIILQSTWAIALTMTGTYGQLLDYVVFADWIFFGLTVASVFVFRKTMPDAPRPFRAWGYPVTPALFVLAAIAIVFSVIRVSPVQSAIGAALMAAGHFAMAFEQLFLFALGLLILGNGAFKPNISTQVGELYAPGDRRPVREDGDGGNRAGRLLRPRGAGCGDEDRGCRRGRANRVHGSPSRPERMSDLRPVRSPRPPAPAPRL